MTSQKILHEERNIYIVLVCTMICSLLYALGQPVWDDHDLLSFLQFTSYSQIIYSPVGLGEIGNGYYRPLSMICLKLLNNVIYIHIFTLLLHTSTTFLVYKITKNNWIMAMLFGLHPLCSEVLAWSSALPDALATSLSAALVLSVYKEKKAFVALCAFGALLSKESAVICVLSLMALHKNRSILGMSLLLYLSLRFFMIGDSSIPFDWNRITLALKGMIWLWGSSLFPFTLTAVRDVWHASPLEITFGFLVPVLVLGVFRNGERHEQLGALMWFFSPVIALPVIASSHLASERYMYMGVFGMALAFSSLRADSPKAWRVGLFLFLASLPLHYLQAQTWKNDTSLFSNAIEKQPESSYSHHLLGYSYLNQNKYEQAAVYFEKGLSLQHFYPTERLLLIQALVLSGQPSKALDVANAGPKKDLTADYLVWWGRAAQENQQSEKAWRIWSPLIKKSKEGTLEILDGPPWFPSYLEELEKKQ